MAITITEGRSPGGQLEYILVGLRESEYWDNVDVIRDILVTELGAKVVEELNGIWERYVEMNRGDNQFELAYHEDEGVFFRSLSHARERDSVLEKMIIEAIPRIETKLKLG